MLLLEKRQGWGFKFRRQMLHEAKPLDSATEEIGDLEQMIVFFVFFVFLLV